MSDSRRALHDGPKLVMFGASYKTAPIEYRERVAAKISDLQLGKGTIPGVAEATLLETCNREELYLVVDGSRETVGVLRFRLNGLGHASGRLEEKHGKDAVEHLFRVSAGLESMVVGEEQVLHQVKAAGKAARAAGTSGHILSQLFEAAYSTGLRARRQHGFHPRKSSVSSLALALARSELGREPRCVLLIGSGQAAGLAMQELHRSKVYLLTQRSARNSVFRAAVRISPAQLSKVASDCDLILAATRRKGYVVTSDNVRAREKKVILDLGFPRNVDPALRASRMVRVFDLDDLAGYAEGVSPRGEQQTGEYLHAEALRFHRWLMATKLRPALAEIFRWAYGVRDEETALAIRKLRLSKKERLVVEALGRRLVSKLLSGPAVFARQEGDGIVQEERLRLLQSIFEAGRTPQGPGRTWQGHNGDRRRPTKSSKRGSGPAPADMETREAASSEGRLA